MPSKGKKQGKSMRFDDQIKYSKFFVNCPSAK